MASQPGSEDKEKSLYLVQIRYLEEQLERCQLKRDKLETESTNLISEHTTLEKDMKDASEYLKRSVAVKSKKLRELSKEFENLVQTSKQDREALKLQHNQQMEEMQQLRDDLDSKRRMQVVRLEEQQEELKQLKQQLTDMALKKEEEQVALRNLQEEAALRKEKVLNNMKVIVDGDGEEQKDERNQQLEQLPFLLKETEPLREERAALHARKKELSCEQDDLKKEISKMNVLKISLSKELEQLKKEYQQLVVEMMDARTAQQHTLGRIEELRPQLHSASEKLRQKSSESDQLEAELQEERSSRTDLEGIKQEAAIILGFILMDSDEAPDTQWKMQRLLEILESCAPSWKTGFSVSGSPQGQKPQTSNPARRISSLKTCSFVDPSDPTPHRADEDAGASTSAAH